jgi:hypothetical protein
MKTVSDMLVTAVSVMLAFSSAGFAGYMVAHGPPGARSDFSLINLAKTRENVSRGIETGRVADPIMTGTATGEDGAGDRASLPPGFFDRAERFDYRLTRVKQETAYVEIDNGIEMVTVPVQKGALVPGIGFARGLEQRASGWVLMTGTLEITEDGISVAR